MTEKITLQTTEYLKTCCAQLYESDWARLLLGDSFHPGGLATTQRLGELLGLRAGQRVLDIASGRGTSAIFLAQHFGCEVVGIDYSDQLVEIARKLAAEAGLNGKVSFRVGDAEQLPFDDASFDAVICECAFCTFVNKSQAAQEFTRVLRTPGRVGLSDLTRSGELPPELDGLLAWMACIADAKPIEEYADYLEQAGCTVESVESQDLALLRMIRDVRAKLVTAELMVKLGKFDFPVDQINRAKTIARSAETAVNNLKLGYAIMVGAQRER